MIDTKMLMEKVTVYLAVTAKDVGSNTRGVDNFSRVIFSIFFVKLNVGLLYKGNSEMVEKY